MSNDSCSVYLFGFPHGAHGHVVKVGISNNVFGRLDQIQSTNPDVVVPHFHFDFLTRSTAREVELRFHTHFKKYNVRGEWFSMGENHALFMLAMEVVRVLCERYARETISKVRRDSGLLNAFEILDRASEEEQGSWNNEWSDLEEALA